MKSSAQKILAGVIVIIVLAFIMMRGDQLGELIETVQRGAVIPLLLAIVTQLCKYYSQSWAYQHAFAATGEKMGHRQTLPLVFGTFFMNTIAPSLNMAGATLVVDDARRRGIPAGKATSAALLMQITIESGFMTIMIVSFIVLQIAGMLNPAWFLLGLLVLALVGFMAGILYMGSHNPKMLSNALRPVERFVNRVLAKLHKTPLKPWAEVVVASFGDASHTIASNPRTAAKAFGCSIVASTCELSAFVLVGVAFGITSPEALVCGYVIATLFAMFSPSPQGVGFVEAAVAVLFSAYAVNSAEGLSAVLVYRGLVFWMPFLIGAVLIQRTKTFKRDVKVKEVAQKRAAKVEATIAGGDVRAAAKEVVAGAAAAARASGAATIPQATPTRINPKLAHIPNPLIPLGAEEPQEESSGFGSKFQKLRKKRTDIAENLDSAAKPSKETPQSSGDIHPIADMAGAGVGIVGENPDPAAFVAAGAPSYDQFEQTLALEPLAQHEEQRTAGLHDEHSAAAQVSDDIDREVPLADVLDDEARALKRAAEERESAESDEDTGTENAPEVVVEGDEVRDEDSAGVTAEDILSEGVQVVGSLGTSADPAVDDAIEDVEVQDDIGRDDVDVDQDEAGAEAEAEAEAGAEAVQSDVSQDDTTQPFDMVQEDVTQPIDAHKLAELLSDESTQSFAPISVGSNADDSQDIPYFEDSLRSEAEDSLHPEAEDSLRLETEIEDQSHVSVPQSGDVSRYARNLYGTEGRNAAAVALEESLYAPQGKDASNSQVAAGGDQWAADNQWSATEDLDEYNAYDEGISYDQDDIDGSDYGFSYDEMADQPTEAFTPIGEDAAFDTSIDRYEQALEQKGRIPLWRASDDEDFRPPVAPGSSSTQPLQGAGDDQKDPAVDHISLGDASQDADERTQAMPRVSASDTGTLPRIERTNVGVSTASEEQPNGASPEESAQPQSLAGMRLVSSSHSHIGGDTEEPQGMDTDAEAATSWPVRRDPDNPNAPVRGVIDARMAFQSTAAFPRVKLDDVSEDTEDEEPQ